MGFGRPAWVWVLIGWTVLLWLSRLRNVLNNDELTTSGRGWRVAVVVVFVVLATLAAYGVRRNYPKLVVVLVVWTIGYWLVRGIGILINGDYSVGFKAIHTVLMAISLILAWLTSRQAAPAR